MSTITDEADSDVGASKARTTVIDSPLAEPVRRQWLRNGIVVAVVLVALYFAGHWLFYDRFRIFTDDALIDTDQVIVTSKITERVERVLVDENQRVHRGQVLAILDDANERAALAVARRNLLSQQAAATAARQAALLEGQLQSAQVREERGGITAAQMAVSLSRSQAAAADRAIAVADAQLQSARAQLVSSNAVVPAAREALVKAVADRDRDAALLKEGYVSTSAMETAVTAVASARAAYDQAVAQAAAAQSAVRTAQANELQQRATATAATTGTLAASAQLPIAAGKLDEMAAPARVPDKVAAADSAQALADAMAAQAQMAQLNLDSTRIVAPVDGWVAARDAQEGQTVAPGQAVVTISPADRIFVTANYKETQLSRIHAGMTAEIAVDACGGEKFRGTVIGFSPVALNALSTLPALSSPTNFVKVAQRVAVRISLPHDAGSCVFRPGTAVETSVLLPH
jgi:membrane fusion protein (multidrug efflux system)